jgi:hypothetical protein
MAEDFSFSELVIPGTYIRVRAEGLISAGGISTGNIGIVGTASDGINDGTVILSDYDTARTTFGDYDAMSAGTLNLNRGIELLYLNGASTVFARAVASTAAKDDYIAQFNELLKDNVQILVAPELSTADALSVLGTVLGTAENNGRDAIAVVGSDATKVADILAQVPNDDRIIFSTPGIRAFDAADKKDVTLAGTYGAAAVAGLISTLTPQSSPTNKNLTGITKLAQRFSYGEMKQLVSGRVLTLEERSGVRVVRGLTSDSGAFKQITTRRITDFAKAGIRKASDPFIGRLNNQRVRKALRGSIDGFLTTMVQDEALIDYTLDVSATRADEIAGRAVVNAVLRPTFSIDFIAVTLVLE